MQIIVEYVLLDNFLIDLLLLYLTEKILKQQISKLGLITASSFGAEFAVLSPLIPISGVLAVGLKLGVAGVLVFMSSFSFNRFWLKFIIFVGLTFVFGGTIIAVFSFLGVSVYDSLYLGYVSSVPLGAILTSGIFFLVFVIQIIKSIFTTLHINEQICKIGVEINNKMATLTGFVDSGNTVKNRNGRSVIIVNEDTLKNWFSPFERIQIMIEKCNFLPNLEKLSVSSLGGNYYIWVFDCRVMVGDIEKDWAIGIAPEKIRLNNCDAIVSKDLLEV